MKQALLCSAIAASIPVTVIAATNPAGTTAQVPLPESMGGGSTSTTTTSGPPNGFKPDGLGTITSTNKDQASKPSDSTTGGKIESPQKVENADLEEAIENCPIAEEQPQAIDDAVQAAMVIPDIDGMFNRVTKEAEGCFANSGQVINLAMMVKIPVFNGGVGTAVSTALERIITAKAQEIKDRVCKIADEALLDTLGPVQTYLQEYQARASELEGITGNIGDARDPSYGKVLGTFGSKIDEAERALNEQGAKASQKAAEANQRLEGIKSEVNSNLEGALKGALEGEVGEKVAQATGSYTQSTAPVTQPSNSTPAFVPYSTNNTNSSTARSTQNTGSTANSTTTNANTKQSTSTQSSGNAFASKEELANNSKF